MVWCGDAWCVVCDINGFKLLPKHINLVVLFGLWCDVWCIKVTHTHTHTHTPHLLSELVKVSGGCLKVSF